MYPLLVYYFTLIEKMSTKCFNNVCYICRLVRHGHSGGALKRMLSKETFTTTSLDVIRRKIKGVPCLKSRGTYLVREKLNNIIRKKKKELQH